MKKVAIIFITAGLFFVIFGGYQLFKTNKAQEKSLAEAEALLTNETSRDTVSSSSMEAAASFAPSTGETVGILHIPELHADLPIVEGTDEDDLEKGVGHYKGTAYPEQQDQIVLSGHRDTVFRRMGELAIGDVLTIKLPYGDFSYEIVDTKVVDADDRTVIASTAPKEVLTVTTCYPFSYIGNAPERYIITALPTENGN
ncbi:class D sortase [Virgibacillus dakarensis]|uniref:Class D sortase n=1 Tax=Lentibacillus populi TaxID=1827502 RepID=A0A9W5X7D2_9BACI|nr:MULTISPECIES: class D sortase [Bacillaceae]MBT2216078.1 class D sortase [Virgibacillus dakarensis]MTW87645.1 class D sortase [Virgibacillus dakarensis]GGB55151.1 hypothetical protein GCM10011409_35960 [Lentibacillus populi]